MNVVSRFEGGRQRVQLFGALGVAGLVCTAFGAALDLQNTLYSYLFAFVFWVSLALGGLLGLTSFHAAKARWPVVLRRPLEAMAQSLWVLLPLFLPIALGMKKLFIWVAPPKELGPQALFLIQHKAPYLNVPFFLIRAAVYFGLWLFVTQQLIRWSRAQDESGDIQLTKKQWRLSSVSLPFVGIALSFASLDWVMSLAPQNYSTIFGFYFFSGSLLAALAVLTLAAILAKGPNLFGEMLGPAHWSSLGKLLLAMTAFWGYIAFCQYMLVWIANLPGEVPFYLSRTRPGWRGVSIFVALGQFLLPFFALLSRRLKQSPKAFAVLCLWILFVHAADLYAIVLPALHPDRPWWRWTDLTALVGIGGVVVAFAIASLRGQYVIPVKDPYLRHSLQYDQL